MNISPTPVDLHRRPHPHMIQYGAVNTTRVSPMYRYHRLVMKTSKLNLRYAHLQSRLGNCQRPRASSFASPTRVTEDRLHHLQSRPGISEPMIPLDELHCHIVHHHQLGTRPLQVAPHRTEGCVALLSIPHTSRANQVGLVAAGRKARLDPLRHPLRTKVAILKANTTGLKTGRQEVQELAIEDGQTRLGTLTMRRMQAVNNAFERVMDTHIID